MLRISIKHKLLRAFLTQVLVISLATALGVYAAALVVENVLVRKALEREAQHFWALYTINPDAARPNTANLLGYLKNNGSDENIPAVLKDIEPGYGRAILGKRHPIVYVEDNGEQRLILVFDEQEVSNLALYFGTVPLSIVLIILYAISWYTYHLSHHAISPLVKLADRVQTIDFLTVNSNELDFSDLAKGADHEVLNLISALQQFTSRIQLFLLREREFTRDASHELRTPLAVILGSLDLLAQQTEITEETSLPLQRIRNTANSMQALTETLLLLAREDDPKLQIETIVLNDFVTDEIEKLNSTPRYNNATIKKEYLCTLELQASPHVLVMVIGNLLRNAINYAGRSEIIIRIDANGLSVIDSGSGMNQAELDTVFKPFFRGQPSKVEGYGLGLSIVKRLCEKFAWGILVESEANAGTQVTIQFPNAKSIN